MIKIKTAPLAAGLLALGFCVIAQASPEEGEGYTSARAAMAAALPAYVVVYNERILPQLLFGVPEYRKLPFYEQVQLPLVAAQPRHPPVAGVFQTAGTIPNAMLYADAETVARWGYLPLKSKGCDLPVADSLAKSVRDSIARSSWGGAIQPRTMIPKNYMFEESIPRDQPRHVFFTSASLLPDFSALVTSVDIAAYAADSKKSDRWKKQALWRDQLIVVSDPLDALPAKTAADIEAMIAVEQARYAASGADDLIVKVNTEGLQASRADRDAAVTAQRLHVNNMRDAKDKDWSNKSGARQRAELWSANDCARLRAAIVKNDAELVGMMDALYAGQLPPRSSDSDKNAESEQAGERKIRALPHGVYVSRNDGGKNKIMFRYTLLWTGDEDS